MLKRLFIKDYAIIDNVVIDFEEGLNVITGETGAGKSIIIGAFGLLLGEPFETDFIRKGAEKTIVEGKFYVRSKERLKEFLKTNEIPDVDDEIIIRREIDQKGKSRSFINDSPVKFSLLKEFGDLLVDLHGQHEHQSLMKSDFYYSLLDQYGKLNEIADEVKKLFNELKKLETEKKNALKEYQIYNEKKEILEFQLKEIKKVSPVENENVEIEREINIMENLEKIWELTNQNFQILNGENDSVIERIDRVLYNIAELIKIDNRFDEIKKYLESALIEIKESAQFFNKYSDQTTYSPERLEQLRIRQNQIYNLKRKYGGSISDVLKRNEAIESELKSMENMEGRINDIDKMIKEKLKNFSELSEKLSEKRKIVAKKMGNSITELLRTLGMKSGLFAIDITKRESIDGIVEIKDKRYCADSHGIDKIEFLVATNKGEDLKPLAKIASLGEVSRVVLAVKSILAEADEIPILIFDEIDVGISGRIATAVSKKLKELSRYHQVICITHLPQIASAGDTHFSAVKKEEKDRVFTEIKNLLFEDRKYEIAKLLGGEKITEINIKNAEELLEEAKKF